MTPRPLLFGALIAVVLALFWGSRVQGDLGPGIVQPAADGNAFVSSGELTLEEPTRPNAADEDEAVGAARREDTSVDRRGIRGRVIDAVTGEPVAYATFHGGTGEVRTSGKGEFRYVDKSHDGYHFVVAAKGYCFLRGRIERDQLGASERIEFPMVVSAPLVGRVVDVDGKPITSAVVRIFEVEGATFDSASLLPEGTPLAWDLVGEGYGLRVVTEDDGVFRLPGVVPRSMHTALRITKLRFHPEVVPLVGSGPGATTELQVVIKRKFLGSQGELAGTVFHEGVPVEADVWWFSDRDERSTRTDENGFYRVMLPSGLIKVVAVPRGADVIEESMRARADLPGLAIIAHARTWQDFEVMLDWDRPAPQFED